eukprot:gene9537-6835_t
MNKAKKQVKKLLGGKKKKGKKSNNADPQNPEAEVANNSDGSDDEGEDTNEAETAVAAETTSPAEDTKKDSEKATPKFAPCAETEPVVESSTSASPLHTPVTPQKAAPAASEPHTHNDNQKNAGLFCGGCVIA